MPKKVISKRLATAVAVNDSTPFASDWEKPSLSSPVVAVFLLGSTSGNITISIVGKSTPPDDTWPLPSFVSLTSRTLSSGGRYYLQISPSTHVNSSTGGGMMSNVRIEVTAASGATTTIEGAYLEYEVDI